MTDKLASIQFQADEIRAQNAHIRQLVDRIEAAEDEIERLRRELEILEKEKARRSGLSLPD